MGDVIVRFLNAQLDIGLGRAILWREIVGNVFGLASALGGARRRIWAWPVGILGNALLFTVFLGGVFHTPQDLDLWGQAGRQIFFIITSAYGWVAWARYRNRHRGSKNAVEPHWATGRERAVAAGAAIVMLVVFYLALKALGSWGPASDSWILTGSIMATYGMARGWNEFWLVWIAVDAVGVPLLLSAHYYPSGLMYIFYAGFCLYGFFTWWRLHRAAQAARV